MRPAARHAAWIAIIAIVVTIPCLLGAAPTSPAAKLFADSCSSCHTIGGGDLAGPDLAVVATWKTVDLRTAVKRMEENAGALTAEQIDALVALLQAPDSKAQLAALTKPQEPEIPLEQKAASAETGRHLFFGEQAFENRGTPCFACHTAGGRGGNLAADLTATVAKRGDAVVLSAAQQPGFPLMKAAYGAHPITKQEAYHLAAFLKSPPQDGERPGVVHAMASGLAAIVFVAVGFAFRSRRHGGEK